MADSLQATFLSNCRSDLSKDRQLDIDDVVEVRSIEDNLADKLDLQLSSTINADPRSRQLTLQTNGSYDVRAVQDSLRASMTIKPSTGQ